MNSYQIRYFLCALLLPVFLVSCGKDDDDDDVSPNVALLTAGEWNGDAVYFNGEDITDILIEEEDFDIRDYSSEFERDGTYTDSFEGQVSLEGDWEFENNERVIVFDKGTDEEYTVVVSKLDEDELNYVQNGYEFRFVR